MRERIKKIKQADLTMIGSYGLVGSRVKDALSQDLSYRIVAPTSSELDITNKDAINEFLDKNPCNVLVNFAAFTDTKAAEAQRENYEGEAWQVNVVGIKNLAEAAVDRGIFLVDHTTDYRFSGKKDGYLGPRIGPYKEDEPSHYYKNNTDPMAELSWYGYTKAQGLEVLRYYNREYGLQFAALDISYPYGNDMFGSDFAQKTLANIDLGRRLVDDQFITPTFIGDISVALKAVLKKRYVGVVNIASPDITTTFEFGRYLAKLTGRDVEKILPMKLAELKGVIMPQYGGLDCTFTQQNLGVKFHTWKQGLNKLYAGQLLAQRD